jgi:hypothetical protein
MTNGAGDTYTDPRGVERAVMGSDGVNDLFGGPDGAALNVGHEFAWVVNGKITGFIQPGVDSTGAPGELIGDVGPLASIPRGSFNMATQEPKATISGPDRKITGAGWIGGVWTKKDGTVGTSGGGGQPDVYVDADGNIVTAPTGATLSGLARAQTAITKILVDLVTGK